MPRCRGAMPHLLGRIFLGRDSRPAPPALIIVHPGSAGATAPLGEAVAVAAAAVTAEIPPPESSEAAIFSAHRVEPTFHDTEPLLFEGDEVHPATPAGQAEAVDHEFDHHDAEHAAEAVLFGSSPETDHPLEAIPAPLSEEGHDLAAEPANAPWGGDWGGFKDEAAHEEAPSAWRSQTTKWALSTSISPRSPARPRGVGAGCGSR